MNFEPWYNKNYKKILIIPAVLLALSLIYIGIFYMQTGDVINKDVSLTGGTTISVDTHPPIAGKGSSASSSTRSYTRAK